MKPKIDLKNPFLKNAIQSFQAQAMAALDAPQSVESGVIPICAIVKRKKHQKPSTKPQQIGSGVLVNIKNSYFIFSATHLFLEIENHVVLTSAVNGESIESLSGERYSTGKLDSPQADIYDATVFEIQSNLSDPLKSIAITLDDFDFLETKNATPVFLASGFRVKKSNTWGNNIKSKRECFPSIELKHKDYPMYGVKPESHIVLSYEDQVAQDNKWVSSPTPRGFSGGAIMKVDGTDYLNPVNRKQNPKQLLTGITTEHHKDMDGRLGCLIGTRINVFLGLVFQFMPDLQKDILSRIQED